MERTPLWYTLDITLETAEDTFQEDMISLQPCYPA